MSPLEHLISGRGAGEGCEGEAVDRKVEKEAARYRAQFRKTKLCDFFQNGHCKHGEACKYAHGPADRRPLPDLKKTSLCPDWLVNACHLASEHCPFAHGVQDRRMTKEYAAARSPGTQMLRRVPSAFADKRDAVQSVHSPGGSLPRDGAGPADGIVRTASLGGAAAVDCIPPSSPMGAAVLPTFYFTLYSTPPHSAPEACSVNYGSLLPLLFQPGGVMGFPAGDCAGLVAEPAGGAAPPPPPLPMAAFPQPAIGPQIRASSLQVPHWPAMAMQMGCGGAPHAGN